MTREGVQYKHHSVGTDVIYLPYILRFVDHSKRNLERLIQQYLCSSLLLVRVWYLKPAMRAVCEIPCYILFLCVHACVSLCRELLVQLDRPDPKDRKDQL